MSSTQHYKSAILGCGPRAEYHAQGYIGLGEVHLHAACDKNEERLENYGKKYKVPALYSDFEEMLAKERLDILHIVTPPTIREEPIELAANYGVKGIIVEKPIALHFNQIAKIKETVEKTGVKIAVNMQRRYYKKCQSLKKVLDGGLIGDIQFMRCVCKGNILSWGPHMIDLLLYFLDDVVPSHVWACAYGMNGYDYGHPAPANMMINFLFPGQITVYLEDAENAVGVFGETDFWQHGELDFWGTKGRAWWAQNRDWGYQGEGMEYPYIENTSWDKDEIPGQREFTRALAQWLDDDNNGHLNCLDNALKGFDLIMATLKAVNVGKRLELPVRVSDDIVQRLESQIK